MVKLTHREDISKHCQPRTLQELWKIRAINILKHKPLDGIYCVYSMYWHPTSRRYQP